MKKTLIALMTMVLLIAFVITGCSDNKLTEEGVLNISINGMGSRGIEPVSMDTVRYDITVRNSSDVIVYSGWADIDDDMTLSTPPGLYKVWVDAKNADGLIIGSGYAEGEVVAGSTTELLVVVSELNGTGTLSISVEAEEERSVLYNVLTSAGTSVVSGPLAYEEGSYRADVELANGFYILQIRNAETGRNLKTESFRIVKSQVTEFNASISIPASPKVYKVGDIGPAGGYIFYDCDADNESGNADGLISTEIGWRYLEAAPADMHIVDGVPTVDPLSEGYDSGTAKIAFGSYKLSPEGQSLYTNGTTEYNSDDCTRRTLGNGMRNTQLLASALDSVGAVGVPVYCEILEYKVGDTVFDDWYIPTRNEIRLMYSNLKAKGLGSFLEDGYYWTSTEYQYNPDEVWNLWFQDNDEYWDFKNTLCYVRPVRAFITDEVCDHSFDDGVVTTEPDCEKNGIVTYTCTECNMTLVKIIPMTGHSFNEEWSYDESLHWHSAKCGHDVVDALGDHSFSDWIVRTAATTESEGEKYRTCTVCGYEDTVVLPRKSSLVIDDEIEHAPAIIIEYAEDYIVPGEELNLSAVVKGPEEFDYLWVIDGEIDFAAFSESDEGVVDDFTISFSEVGEHEISLYVRSDMLIWSESAYVTVSDKPNNTEYSIGDIGPAGGYIFYDCDADNESGNADGLISTEVGWRYLEAASADLRVVDGVPTVDSSQNGYSSATTGYIFGFYRTSDGGSPLLVNGATTYSLSDCTGTEIGTGKRNTQLLVSAMGTEAYSSYGGSSKTGNYAAKLCEDLSYTVDDETFDDWFLPSHDELNLMYENLNNAGLGGFVNYDVYWSSSEINYFADHAWIQTFDNGSQDLIYRNNKVRVRAVRAFLTEEVCEHVWDEGVVTSEATCEKNGIKTYTCTKCNMTKVEIIPMITYAVGDIGPAGGYIFYDCDADNDSGNSDGLISTEVGWRYLEAAPADIRVVDGVPTVDSSLSGYSSSDTGYVFGYHRTSDGGSNLYVNGATTYSSSDCTGTQIGTGKRNTQLLVSAMGTEAYSSYGGSSKTGNYAAKLCEDLSYTVDDETFDDWFLPSHDELNLMYENLNNAGLGGFANDYYWSSSEYSYYAYYAWEQDFSSGDQGGNYRGPNGRVRAVRAF